MKKSRLLALSMGTVLTLTMLPGNSASPEQALIEKDTTRSNALGLLVLKRMFDQKVSPDGNIVLSPAGIASTLAILQPGSRGDTKDALDHVLGQSTDGVQAFQVWQNIRQHNRIAFRQAERVFLSNKFAIDDFYPSQAMVTRLDLAQNPEQSTQSINQWVAQQTNGAFQLTLTDGSVGEQTPMVAVGAFTFSGIWETPFPASSVTKGNFRVGSQNVETSLMTHEVRATYATTPDYTMLALPYAPRTTDGKTPSSTPLLMVMIMPSESSTLRNFLRDLTPEKLQGILPSSPPCKVRATIPAFKTVTADSPSLKPFLEFAGLGVLFSPSQADFSGLVATPPATPLFLGDFYQQCMVTVTAVNDAQNPPEPLSGTSSPEEASSTVIPAIRIDRSFFWCIYDPNTGNIIFMGTEEDPSRLIPNPYDVEENQNNLSEPDSLSPLNRLHRQERDHALEKLQTAPTKS